MTFLGTWIVAVTSCVLVGLLVSAGLISGRPSRALPAYSRRYGVSCQTCHSIPPRLNRFGLAFQANHFNWLGGLPPAYHAALAALPADDQSLDLPGPGAQLELLRRSRVALRTGCPLDD